MTNSYQPKVAVLILIISSFAFTIPGAAQDFCYPDGNVIIYSNYDGGYLNIEVDEDIPNLKIGITTYEKCEVTISGQYAGNVTEVIYAGFNGNNDHCNPTPPTTSINGVPVGITSILIYPPATWPNGNGNNNIICNYSCDSATSQGGCNTPDQIVHYYLTEFGGSLCYHFTQYNCWQGTYEVSDAGNCCIGSGILEPQFSIDASFTVPNDTLCIKDSLLFFNNSSNSYPGATFYTWDFGDGTPVETSEDASHIYATPGNYTVTLVASNSDGTAIDTFEIELTLINCFTDSELLPLENEVQMTVHPISGKLCFMFHATRFEESLFRLYDPFGRLLIAETILPMTENFCVSRTMHQLPVGLYYAQIEHKDELQAFKVIFYE